MPEALVIKDLPKEGSKDYYKILVENCIQAYAELQDDGLALDLNGVIGKDRAIVLDNSDYRRETRKIRAKKYLDEINEIKDISDRLDKLEKLEKENAEDYDIRGGGKKGKKGKNGEVISRKDFEDQVKIRMKVAEMRRELFFKKGDEENDEANALNIFFVSVTQEEFEKLETTEVHYGEEVNKASFSDGENEKKKIPGHKEKKKTLLEDTTPHFVKHDDGTIEEV